MRKPLSLAVVAFVAVGCQPKILYFNAQPQSVPAGPANVTLNWKISAGDGHLSADQPVTPSLDPPPKVDSQGSRSVQVCKTTTFTLEPHYGGERTVKVTVAKPCGTGTCGAQILTFTGTCMSALQGPSYTIQTVDASLAPGSLQDLQSDAGFPVHVLHAGSDIAVGAGGGPLFPLPSVPAAGDYQIYVPGQVGIDICKDATSPVGGGQADAPPVHLTVVPACPKP